MEPAELTRRRELIDVCRSFGPRRLSAGTSGNASVRWRDGMLITPSAVPYDDLDVDDIVWVGFDGTRVGGRPPSSEWRFHRRILAGRDDLDAVVHVHSPAATALACLRRDLPPFHYMVAVAGGTDIRCAPYALFGTDELADAVATAMAGRRAALLANHGQIAASSTPARALELAVEVEMLAEQYLLACSAGDPQLLSAEEMAAVTARFARYRAGTLD